MARPPQSPTFMPEGPISGSLRGSATTVTPTADTPNTSVLTFTSDSTITGAVKGNRGTLVVKNAGVFTTRPDGSIVDLQTVVGGTVKLAGAQGFGRASGTFPAVSGGTSDCEGSVCVG